MHATLMQSLCVLVCALVVNPADARISLRTGLTANTSFAPRASFRCLTCNSERFPACHDPIVQRIPVRDCERFVTGCYTRFGVGQDVERGCFDKRTLHVIMSCATPFCNNARGPHLPIYYSNQYEWTLHLKLMKETMRTSKQRLWCVSCVTTDFVLKGRRVDGEGNQNESIIQNSDCFHMPRNKVAENSKLCETDEVCKLEMEEQRFLRRSCSKVANDHVVVVCGSDFCNLDVITLSATPFLHVVFSGGNVASECSIWFLYVVLHIIVGINRY